MKKILMAAVVLTMANCTNKPKETATTGGKDSPSAATPTTATAPVSSSVVPKDSSNKPAAISTPTTGTNSVSKSGRNCASVGKSEGKFEQNGAKFERFADPKAEGEASGWLKITLPDGSCKIVDNIGNANHASSSFEDWNGDGFKDRIDDGKWRKEVSLFSKTKNDFSDKIDGEFSGEQHDYDKAKGLKWQHLEDKMGGTYQLYKLVGLKLTALSEINVSEDDNGKPEITIQKSVTQPAEKKVDNKTFLLPKKNGEEQIEASVKRYWDSIAKNLK